MKIFNLLMPAMLVLSHSGMAQNSEPLSANKHTKSERENQMFLFPDNIRLSKNELNERVEAKTKELTGYIKLLAESKDSSAKRILIDKAMRLFNNNEYAMVSVTRKSEAEPVTVPVRTYLNRLGRLKYDMVRITWHNAQYVSNFTKQPNGTYSGLVAFEQQFTGIKGGEANYTYSDVTQKRIEVVVKVWDARDEAQNRIAYMDAFLGNIGVTEE